MQLIEQIYTINQDLYEQTTNGLAVGSHIVSFSLFYLMMHRITFNSERGLIIEFEKIQ